jgi:hypothetical protein
MAMPLSSSAAKEPKADKEQRVKAKQTFLCESLWDTYMEIGSEGSLWNPARLASTEGAKMLKDFLIADWVESQSLPAHVATSNEWKKFATELRTDWNAPDIISERQFL